MTELLTAAQMRAIEQAAIASGEVTGLELMERAGRGVVEAIFEQWPELAPSWGPARRHYPSDQWRDNSDPPEFTGQDDKGHRAVVLCGPGNNGGDGFVVARLLKETGWDVEVFLYGDAEGLPPDARVNYKRWGEMGEVRPYEKQGLWSLTEPKKASEHIVLIEALFGTGQQHREGSALLSLVIDIDEAVTYHRSADANYYCVAVDTPVNSSSDTGKADGWIATYDLLVSFHADKIGHYLNDIAKHVNKTTVADIGLGSTFQRQNRTALAVHHGNDPDGAEKGMGRELEAEFVFLKDHLPVDRTKLSKFRDHKYSYGHALILSGGIGKGGAARLAARGALRVGAGAVTVGCPPAALMENAAQLNAVMLRSVKDVDGLDDALSDDRINALCMGPGMGVSVESRDLVEAGLKSGRAIVLDADALTLIGRDAPLFASLHEKCVLTPHGGEFARLFPDIAAKLDAPATKGPAYSKVDATREAAERAGCVVLFKGPDTVIADPSGRCSINASVYERSAPWLATAGSGDVLAGFITGLLARDFTPMQAAETGAWLHTECALSFGPALIAEDLPEELPRVFRALGV
jgi:hydroxyethylthiazole kinase-like uncharacterized protein yjeF